MIGLSLPRLSAHKSADIRFGFSTAVRFHPEIPRG